MTTRCIYEGERNYGTFSAISLCGTFLHGVDPVTLTRHQDETLPVCAACEKVLESRRARSLKARSRGKPRQQTTHA